MFTYNLNERNGLPIYQFLYQKLKQDILNGQFRPGSRLPSKRTLSEDLGISVITVEYAYRLLADEGYIISHERSGFFVCDLHHVTQPQSKNRLIPCSDQPPGELPIDFPVSSLSKIMRRVISRYGETLLLKPPHNGCAVLRNAISEYLLRYRGMTAQPEQIVIGSGAEYLYMLTVQLLGRDKIFGIENPCYKKIKAAYEASGAECELLDMDENGISSESLSGTQASVLHVTPFHSYPSGVTAPASKRFEYLFWAKRTGGIIVEDDFDSEFAVGGKPVETVFSMDKNDSVLYLNTFSKSLAPSMRTGYMILPRHLTEAYEEKLGFYSCSVPVFDQYVLAEFISEGYFERHLNRIRRKLQAAKKELPSENLPEQQGKFT